MFHNYKADIKLDVLKNGSVTDEQYDYVKLDTIIKDMKPKKVIFGIGNEPLSKFNTNPYFIMMALHICRNNKVKAVIVTEQQPLKHMFLEYFDEVLYLSNFLNGYITDQFSMLNFANNVRMGIRELNEDSLEKLSKFKGKVTIYKTPKGDGVIPANVRFSLPKGEDYQVLLPNGELIPINL